MGAAYYAYAVIGVEATGKLHTVTKRPSCEHRPSGAFCSTCGKPNKTVEVKEPIAGYDEEQRSIGTLRVVHTTDNKKSFVGIAVETGNLSYDDHRHLSLGMIADRINDLRRQLTEIGLWDEASFGLWAVGYCAY
jgi:hypothetical protein